MSYPKHGEVERMTTAERVEYLSALTFEQRQTEFGKLSEDQRKEVFETAPAETLNKWVAEEKADFEAKTKDQPVEGAEFAQDPGEEVKIDGEDAPQDRAPDEDPGVIKELVGEKLKLTQELAAAHAECDAYYQRFGPLA